MIVQPTPRHENTSTVQLFNFKGADVRLVQIEGNPWFVAKEVCELLGYSNSSNMLRLLDDCEKMATSHLVIGSLHHKNVLLSESGLYKPVMRSNKPEAKSFQDWVTKDVLPAIRKDGAYVSYICRVFSPTHPQRFSLTSHATLRDEDLAASAWFIRD